MATIITLQASDSITNSRADINTSLANLNSDKIETSYLDTDTTLAANSDSKIATQKAVKTYIDTSGGANASETVRGIVEEATDAEVTSGSATGGTGAKLFVSPAKLLSSNYAQAKSMTAGATINGATLPVPVYQNTSDNEFYACDANDTAALKFLGFAITNGTDGAAMTVQFSGVVGGFSGLDEGLQYYVSDTVGTISTTPGTYQVQVGIAISTTQLVIVRGKKRYSGAASLTGTATSSITLGFRPAIVRIYAGFGGVLGALSVGYSDGTSNRCVVQYNQTNASENSAASANTSKAWSITYNNNADVHDGVVDTISATGFRLNQTKQSGTDRAIDVLWEAEGDF